MKPHTLRPAKNVTRSLLCGLSLLNMTMIHWIGSEIHRRESVISKVWTNLTPQISAVIFPFYIFMKNVLCGRRQFKSIFSFLCHDASKLVSNLKWSYRLGLSTSCVPTQCCWDRVKYNEKFPPLHKTIYIGDSLTKCKMSCSTEFSWVLCLTLHLPLNPKYRFATWAPTQKHPGWEW